MNPIIRRELVGMLRTRRALVLQVCLVAALTLLVVLRWPSEGQADLSGQAAQQVIRVFGYGLMVGLILLAPVFPATSIVREKQQGTLALLLNSPMGPGAILTGKLLGMLGFVLLLVVLSLPAAAACYSMGGIDLFGVLGKVYLVLILLAVQYATVGLLISSYAGSTDSALRLTYGAILGMSVLTLGPHRFLQSLLTGPAAWVVDWVRCLSPIPAMMEALGHSGVGAEGTIGMGNVAGRYALLAVLTTALFIALLYKRLSERLLDKPRPPGQITDEQSSGVQTYRSIMYLGVFDPQRRSNLIGLQLWRVMWAFAAGTFFSAITVGLVVRFESSIALVPAMVTGLLGVFFLMAAFYLMTATNPVMVKESWTRKFGRGHWMMRLIAGCVVISLGLMLAATRSTMSWGVDTLGGIMVLLQVALVILITPSLASGLISAERESGGWTLLQMTPLSAATVVRGKLSSVFWTLLLVLLATLPGYAIMIAIDPDGQTRKVAKVLVSLGLTALFALLLSAAVSSLFKRTAGATTTAYTLLVGLCAGTMLFWIGQDAPFTHSTVEAVLRFNPLAGALQLIEAPGFKDYHLVPYNWYIMGIGSVVCFVVLVAQTWRLTRPQ